MVLSGTIPCPDPPRRRAEWPRTARFGDVQNPEPRGRPAGPEFSASCSPGLAAGGLPLSAAPPGSISVPVVLDVLGVGWLPVPCALYRSLCSSPPLCPLQLALRAKPGRPPGGGGARGRAVHPTGNLAPVTICHPQAWDPRPHGLSGGHRRSSLGRGQSRQVGAAASGAGGVPGRGAWSSPCTHFLVSNPLE